MKPNLLLTLACCAALQLFAAGAPARPHIPGLSHIALYVHDLEKSRAFYKNFLGFDEPYSLTNRDGGIHLTFIKVNDRQFIELFPEKEAGGDRLNHISVQTDDIEAMRNYLAARGVKVPGKANKGRVGNVEFNVDDPDGHPVEFVQYMPDSWTMKAKGKFPGNAPVSTRMKHLGIIVTNLDAAMKFYGGVLGFQEIWRGGSATNRLSWVNMKVPDGDDYIEFMLYAKLPLPDKRGTAHHLCLEAPDVEKAKALLESRAAKIGYTRPMDVRVGINRKRQLNLYDPDGTRVEVMEPDTVDGVPAPSSTAPPPG